MDADGPADFSSRHDPDFQNLHRNKRAMALNLKHKDGSRSSGSMAAKADIVVENYRPDVKNRLGIDYEVAEGDQSAHHLCQHFGLRPGRPVQGSAGRRSDRAGHVRVDVGDGRGRPRSDARRHRRRRCRRRPLRRDRHSRRAARARALGAGPMGRDLAAGGAAVHARLPGRALSDEGRGRAAGRQQPSDRRADRHVQDAGRLHQYRADAADVAALLQRHRPRGTDRPSRLRDPARTRRAHRAQLNALITAITEKEDTAAWSIA